ncbi:MAG: hypothetical protein J5510_06455 [Prevotella sp.]|nr:hypothetical protein [Prevotella sp.]
MEQNSNNQLEVITVSKAELCNIVEDTVDKVMEKWFNRQVEQAFDEELEKSAFITEKELEEMTGLKRGALYQKVKNGIIKNYRQPNKRRNLFKKSEVLQAINSGLLKRQ